MEELVRSRWLGFQTRRPKILMATRVKFKSQRLSRIQTLEAKRQFLLDLLDSWIQNSFTRKNGQTSFVKIGYASLWKNIK